MDTSFGIGASSTLFGSSGSSNFITRMTAVMGTLFLLLSLILGNISSHDYDKNSDIHDSNLVKDMRISTGSTLSSDKVTNDILK
ncbi:Preprotein translocase subunit SecG [Candidatus Palibaumannia cicadellinicola]|uniref:Protein-export membrane protein SecG n=2 Tax=Candidatus Palibaumannia cicadellinicola TaxID=186490 RepID=A0A088MYU9_9GAMM|nr:Preprotein translocase subunit SecG [Candidatus Baumannia cicadellinicola]